MTRGHSTLLLSALLLVGLALGNQYTHQNQQQQQNQQLGNGYGKAQPFQAGYEYTFTYNGQISTGLKTNGESASSEPQQQSCTRVQTQCKIQFQSDRHATLRLEQIRIGNLNQRVQNPQQVQPMGMFEQKQISGDKRKELELPCQFSYVDGVVERIEFHQEDSPWSKNIKRSVLNMIQLNLKRNNAQGARDAEELSAGPKPQQSANGMQDQQQQQQGLSAIFGSQNSFTIPEMTIEGECQTTYTVSKNQQQQQQQQNQQGSSSESNENDDEDQQQQYQQSSCQNCFNVTKSINFKQCSKIADVAFGYQNQQLQPQCAQCQQQWQWQLQQNQQAEQGQQQQQPHPCDQCDPKEVKEQKLDRSTVLRFVLQGKKQKYGIKRAELLSQYTYKSLASEAGKYGAALQAVVACELVLQNQQQCNSPKCSNYGQHSSPMKASNEQSESLLYSNVWDVEEKRFYMYGDDEFVGARGSPFAKVQNKPEQAQQIIRKLAQSLSDKSAGIEVEVAIQLQRLVEVLRMCTVQELKSVFSSLRSSGSQQGQRSDIEQQKQEHIFVDALAIAGTRNTIFMLVDSILNHNISPQKAAQTLKSLQGLPAPSDTQVDQVLRLCKNEICHRSAALKQSCWLTFGSMIGELCQHKTQKNAQQSVFGAQSGFSKEEVCPQHKKEIYRQTLFEQYQQADSTYEQVLALKALGNAGIDIAVNQLEQIIQNKQNGRIQRIQAIDALRRLRAQMPRKIQRILLPVFQNTKEQPEVRMAAFSMIMHTQPEQPIVDQIAYTLTKERNQHVQSYVYSCMKNLAKSQVPCQQSLAKHLKNALKLANVDESTLRSSRNFQVPILNQEEKEGIVMTLTSAFGNRNMLPSHISARIDTMLNDEFDMNALKVGFTQQDIEGVAEKLMQMWSENLYGGQGGKATRGQRSQRRGSETLRQIYSALNIKTRQSSYNNYQSFDNDNSNNNNNGPFAMVGVRMGDVDQVIVPVDPQNMPQVLKQMLQGQKPSLSNLLNGENSQQHFRLITALNPVEKSAKIPTSCGIPIRILTSTPILASIEGQVKVNSADSNSQSGLKLNCNVHVTITGAHIQKMVTWMPIFVTGVESIRSIEINAPINAQIQPYTSSTQQGGQQQLSGVQVTIKVPQQKTRVLGIHTLPMTFTRELDQKTKMLREPRVKTIHNEQLEQLQREVHMVVGEHTLGCPFHVKGHYHVPANPTDYKQLVQLAMATENQVHVTFEPIPDTTPKEIRLRISGQAFQKVAAGSNAPQLGQFYTNSVKFEHAYPEDFADMQLEDHNQRREQLNNYIGQYQPQQSYKHQIKAVVETVGGRKQCKAQADVKATCDSQLKFCKLGVELQRSPLYPEEQGQWTLQSNIQIVTPESVSSVQQLEQLAQKNKRFVCLAETQWGCDGCGPKQSINLRIQGENAKNAQWRQIEQSEGQQYNSQNNQQMNKYYKKRTAFLNKYDAVVDYKLKPQAQNLCSRVFEAFKAANFWNTQSEMLNQRGREGQLHATLVIDPITQQHANVSVKTAGQTVRIQSVQLPTNLRPFPLIRQNPQKSTHSVQQLFSGIGSSGRAECKVNGQRVETFDNVLYKAPLSNCYSVLAKDCSSDEPQFAVMMKCQQSNGAQGCSSQQGKKIQVLTQEQVIECQPKQNQQQQQKLQCKVNGQVVQDIGNNNAMSSSEQEQSNYNQNSVEYDNEDQTSVTINVPGVQVRFNGQKAVIKISNQYKQGQCGLCGHYNDDSSNVLRMSNNELTTNLAQFHQSYSFQQDEECNQADQQNFYKQTNQFQMDSQEQDNQPWNDDEQQQDQGYGSSSQENDNNNDEEDFGQDDSWWGQSNNNYGGNQRNWQNKQQQKKQQQKRNCSGPQCGNNEQDNSQWTEEPVKQTKVIEYNHKICFSVEPVKQCPEGTSPQQQQSDNSDDEEANNQQQQQQSQQKNGRQKKMQFTCLPRSSVDARRLQRQARRGVIVDVSAHTPSFVENVQQPQSCVRY